MPLAARLEDLHECSQETQVGPVAVPHVGGPILGPGVSTVEICGSPASVKGDMCMCIAPEMDTIQAGSTTVKIGGKPAARMGDPTAHGGKIVLGAPTVMIGG